MCAAATVGSAVGVARKATLAGGLRSRKLSGGKTAGGTATDWGRHRYDPNLSVGSRLVVHGDYSEAGSNQLVIGSLVISPSTIRQIPKGLLSRNFVGQRGLGKSLVTNRPAKTENRLAAYRGRASIGGRGIGAAVHHGVGNFNAGGETVEHQPADFVLQNRNQIAELVKVGFRAMNGRGQMAAQIAREFEHLGAVGVADDQGRRTEDLRRQLRISQK